MPFGHSKSPTSSSAKEKTFVESLKYKTMRVGMKILGVVCETSERGLVVSLPNGLKGNVTRAEAGEAFYHEKTGKRKGKMMNEESDDDDDDDDEKSDSESSDSEDETGAPPLSLQAAFQVGQLVRCVVNRLEKGKSGGKRIDLTTRVSKTCAGLTKESLADGVNVPAEVVSVEDHGFVLSFGIDGAPPGFLPRKATGPGRGLVQGSLLDVVLTGADRETKDDDENETNESEKSEKKKPKRLAPAKRNVLTVTADPKRVANAVTHETDTTSLGTLLPGMLVNARVKSVLVDGIGVNFMTYFVANCDAFHVADASSKGSVESTKVHGPATDLARTHKVGDRFRARVVFVDVETKRVGVSLR
jgi:rRNA biogenesis protein RRP5